MSFASAPARAAAATASDERGAGIPRAVGQRGWSSGPTLSAEIQRAVVCDLSLEDGVVTATAVLYHTMVHLGRHMTGTEPNIKTYVPHRLEEGYGLNLKAIQTLA